MSAEEMAYRLLLRAYPPEFRADYADLHHDGGVFLMRRAEGSMTRAQGAALACLAAFVLMLVISPRLSVFANMLGIGFPAILIGCVQFRRGKGRQTPLMG
ncbi:hypothetical protein BH09GEM1_BH09GEM1_22800 [soil metagenome]